MSFSIPSACRPEMIRRPTISARLDDADDADRDDQPGERSSVPRRASIPSIASPTSRTIAIAAACESDREDRRDEQRPAVRPQEAEQADERAAVGDGRSLDPNVAVAQLRASRA